MLFANDICLVLRAAWPGLFGAAVLTLLTHNWVACMLEEGGLQATSKDMPRRANALRPDGGRQP